MPPTLRAIFPIFRSFLRVFALATVLSCAYLGPQLAHRAEATVKAASAAFDEALAAFE
jgi:hypothetical protein